MNQRPGNEERGTLLEAHWPDGRITGVLLLTFGRGRIAIGRPENKWWDDMW
jgi:hypothetical protein